MPKYLLIQDAPEVNMAKTYFTEEFHNLKLIACTPSAVDGFRAANLDFICFGNLFEKSFDWKSKEALFEAYGKWCRRIDAIISEQITEFSRLRIKPFLHHFLDKRGLFFRYFMEIDKLSLLVDESSSNIIYYYRYSGVVISPLSQIIESIRKSDTWNVTFEQLDASCVRSGIPENIQKISDFIKPYDANRNHWIKIILRWIIDYTGSFLSGRTPIRSISSLLTALTFGKYSQKGKNILVFTSTEAETNPLLRTLKKNRNINIIFWDEILPLGKPEIDVFKDTIINRVNIDQGLKKFTFRKGIDISHLVYPEIERIIKEELVTYYQNVIYFNRLHEKLGIHLVITSYELPLCEAIFQQCERYLIPRIVNMHGGTIGITDGFPPQDEYVRDGGNAHYTFVYTQAIKAYCNNKMKRFSGSAKFVDVQSSYYKSLFQKRKNILKKNNDTINICFPVGGFGPMINPSYKIGVLDDACQYDLLYKVAEKVTNTENIKLTVKCGYGIEKYGLDLYSKFDNIKFIPSNKSFVDVMGKYDFFILYNLSTTLFEIISTNKPALVLADPKAYAVLSNVKKLLSRRVSLVESQEKFLSKLDNLVRYGWKSTLFTDPDSANNEFFHEYCWNGKVDPAEYGAQWIKENIL